MGMSKAMRAVHNWAQEKDAEMTASDFGPGCVRVVHEDGATFWFPYAFAIIKREDEREYLVVFTEHTGFHVFAMDDLQDYGVYYRSACGAQTV